MMASFSTPYIFGFASALCVVCGLAVASTSLGLRPLQEINKERDKRSAILEALALPGDGSKPVGAQIDKLWEDRVSLEVITADGKPVTGDLAFDKDGSGTLDEEDVRLARDAVKGTDKTPEILALYTRNDGGKTGAYAVPVYGSGLWGPISGYIAIESNGTTVMGATFFAGKETPGLGAEIMEPAFEDQWKGKKVAVKGKAKTIGVIKRCPDNGNCVDSVSGATITSRGVDVMVAQAIEQHYDPYLRQVRKGKGKSKSKGKSKGKGKRR